MKIKLYDLVGIKSGMNFYSEAFCRLLEENNIQTDVMSNFSYNNERQQLPNVFVGAPLKKIINLLFCYFKLFFAILKLKKDEYIIVFTYGLVIDIPLFLMGKLNKRVIFDIHEITALDHRSTSIKKSFLNRTLLYLFRTSPNKVISHSEKTSNILTEISFKSEVLFVPLFNYSIDSDYDIEKIEKDVLDAIEEGSRHFLFFGNIRPTKGIVKLLAAAELLKDKSIKIIVAGQDLFNKIQEYRETHVISDNVTLILRLINDDEMKLLYSKSQVVLLPYEDVSQSAVLESAVNFKKPLLTSDIVYFKTILSNFSSFGRYTNTTDPMIFANSIAHFADEDLKKDFYNKTDLEAYRQKDKFDAFVKQLKALQLNKA